jgi:hypothetical protein
MLKTFTFFYRDAVSFRFAMSSVHVKASTLPELGEAPGGLRLPQELVHSYTYQPISDSLASMKFYVVFLLF